MNDYNNPLWHIRVFTDGDMYCAVFEGFENLQESEAAFADSPEQAVNELFKTHFNNNPNKRKTL